MQDELSQFYLNKEEPLKGTLLALHDFLIAFDPRIQVAWKYKSPFFVYQGKNICYLWFDKKNRHPYVGIIDGYLIDHPLLVQGDRKRIKILPIHPEKDFPVDAMKVIFAAALTICEQRNK